MPTEMWIRLPTTEHPFETIDPQVVIAGTRLPLPFKNRDGRVIGQIVELAVDVDGWLAGRAIVDDDAPPSMPHGSYSIGAE